jgi:hypothetical protein
MKESDYADNAIITVLIGICILLIELTLLLLELIPSYLIVYAIFISEMIIIIVATIFTVGALIIENLQEENCNDPLYEPSIKIKKW